MRRMNALQLALGSVGAGLGGYQKAKTERLEDERRRQLEEAALARQAEQDKQAQAERLASLLASGWETPESFTQQQTGARNAIGALAGSAMQAAATGIPSAGPSKPDLTALQAGFATAQQPTRKISIGGRELVLRETAPERQERLASTQALQEKTKFEEAIAPLPADVQRIAQMSRVLPPNVLQAVISPKQEGMTEYQRKLLELRERELGMRGQERTKEEKPRFGEISSLRKEFNIESRPYKTINDKLREIEALGSKPNPTPQDMEALVRAFVKVQDPTSVVRESEFKTAANTGALADKVENYGNRIAKGEFLSPKQRADMVQTARLLREEAMKQYGQLANSYESLATSFGMNPQNIVANRIDKEATAGAATPKPAGGARSLEQEFPGREAQIKAARAQGYSDADIRTFLTRGR